MNNLRIHLLAAMTAATIASPVVAQPSPEELMRSVVPPTATCQRLGGEQRQCDFKGDGREMVVIYTSPSQAAVQINISHTLELSAFYPYLSHIALYFVGLGVSQATFDRCASTALTTAKVGYGGILIGSASMPAGKLVINCKARAQDLSYLGGSKNVIMLIAIEPKSSF